MKILLDESKRSYWLFSYCFVFSIYGANKLINMARDVVTCLNNSSNLIMCS